MYIQNDTGKDIAAAIGDITFDTSGLAKDSTLQAVNTSLQEIKEAIRPANSYISDRKTSAQAVTVPSATHTVILQLSLTAGLWIINGSIVTPSGSGYRQVYVANAADSLSAFQTIITTQQASTGIIAATTVSGVVELEESTNLYLKLRHSNGSDLAAYGVFNAVKVG